MWNGKAFALLADSEQDISRWLANRRGEKEAHDSPSGGLLLWLDAALTPAEYPRQGGLYWNWSGAQVESRFSTAW